MAKREVVVTTDSTRRGVFCGELVSGDIVSGNVTLINAQMCVYWSQETKGVLGLASQGPQSGSRVTPVIPRIELNGVTSIMDMQDKAVETWRNCPWR